MGARFWAFELAFTGHFNIVVVEFKEEEGLLLIDVILAEVFHEIVLHEIRNAHNYLDDFKDEIQLYTDTTRLIDFLANWTSTSTDLETCIVELMMAMAVEKFIGEADVDLAQRWIKDMKSVGYVIPKVATPFSSKAVELSLKEDPFNSEIRFEEEPQLDAFRDVLIVVNFNEGGLYDKVVPPYLDIYKKYFPNIVFYGSSPQCLG
ncbi:hypothetical protein BGZ59_011100 [Podila verticillata]|nr:hypothetical protein BGZ59_011100 [Podila verticillata]